MDEVFTLSFFRLMHLPLHTSSKHEGLFNCFSSVNKKGPFVAFLWNSSQNRKNVHQFLHFYQFCLIFIRKDEVFHGLLFYIINSNNWQNLRAGRVDRVYLTLLVLGLNPARSLRIMHIPRYPKAGFFGRFSQLSPSQSW